MASKRPHRPFKTPRATPEEAQRRYKVLEDAIRKPRDESIYLNELESALGMYVLAYYFGWKVPYLVHSKRTIKKYEDLLGLKLSEHFDEFGPDADRTNAHKVITSVSNFWKLVSGNEKSPLDIDKRVIGTEGT